MNVWNGLESIKSSRIGSLMFMLKDVNELYLFEFVMDLSKSV